MAALLLRAGLERVGVVAEVWSAGTLGWNERPATAHAVTVMAERGHDLQSHVSRRLEPADLDVDLVVAMTRVHAGAVIARQEALRPQVFLPAEFARLARTAPPPDLGSWRDRVRAVGERRDDGLIGRPMEEIADPAGEGLDVYRATAQRLDRDLTGLVAALTA